MTEYFIKPIGYIRSEREKMEDDEWSKFSSRVELVEEISEESLWGLQEFSHVEVLFLFHKVDLNHLILRSEHPRENPNWPKVGIFSQRKKNRPNRIGTTISGIKKIEGKCLYLEKMDAIDGTPVIDLKPVMKEFLPDYNLVRQPQWSQELMKNYW